MVVVVVVAVVGDGGGGGGGGDIDVPLWTFICLYTLWTDGSKGKESTGENNVDVKMVNG